MIGHVTGNRGQELRRIEEDTGTFCFMADDGEEERMVILGADIRPPPEGQMYEDFISNGKVVAERKISDLISNRLRHGDRRDRDRDRDRRRYSRSRSRSRRRRSPSYRGGRDRRRSRSEKDYGRSRRRSPSYSRSRSRGRGRRDRR